MILWKLKFCNLSKLDFKNSSIRLINVKKLSIISNIDHIFQTNIWCDMKFPKQFRNFLNKKRFPSFSLEYYDRNWASTQESKILIVGTPQVSFLYYLGIYVVRKYRIECEQGELNVIYCFIRQMGEFSFWFPFDHLNSFSRPLQHTRPHYFQLKGYFLNQKRFRY